MFGGSIPWPPVNLLRSLRLLRPDVGDPPRVPSEQDAYTLRPTLTTEGRMLGFTPPGPRTRPPIGDAMSGPPPIAPEKKVPATPRALAEYFAAGAKPVSAWRVGIEHEKIPLTSDGGPLPFSGDAGIEELLRRLEQAGLSGVREDGHLLAVERNDRKITVEPGGQVEHAGPALTSVARCRDCMLADLREVAAVGAAIGMRFVGVGLTPFATLDELPWLPKRRYRVMREYLPERGNLGVHMMKRTATVQANFDFDDEATAADKLRTAFGVTSIVTALAAASPLGEGRPNGYQSYRAAIWLDTDPSRCGLLPAVFEPGFGFRHYVEWALDVPMFFIVREDLYHRVPGLTFRRFMREGWQGQPATLWDWETHLSTLFPEVRLKRFIEVRGADAGPLEMVTGVPALWRGLLDDRDACLAAWRLVASASFGERETLRREVPRQGLSARFGGHSVRDLAVELCRISADGLSRLPGGADDLALLEPVRRRAATGRTFADEMLDDFIACGGDRAALVARWDLAAQAASVAPVDVSIGAAGGAARI